MQNRHDKEMIDVPKIVKKNLNYGSIFNFTSFLGINFDSDSHCGPCIHNFKFFKSAAFMSREITPAGLYFVFTY